MSRRLIPIAAVLAVVAGAVIYFRRDHEPRHFTGFIEGEERIVRSEVTGRILEVPFAEGDAVPPHAVIAVLDDRDIQAKIKSQQQEIEVAEADIRTQSERVELTESSWQKDVKAGQAQLDEAKAAAELADRTFEREKLLVKAGITTPQRLDDLRAQRDQTRSAVTLAEEMLAKTRVEERNIALARLTLDSMKQKLDLSHAQLDELRVTLSKYSVHSPAVPTVVQTQYVWPGELAQPGTAIVSVLDPKDKYVQIYVPVPDLGLLHIGQRVDMELDSRPGSRIPGEISFIADKANFTPEKIETRSDRMGQVYRVKVRVLDGVEQLKPGTEGNVYLVDGAAQDGDRPAR